MQHRSNDLVWCCAELEAGVRLFTFKKRSEIEHRDQLWGVDIPKTDSNLEHSSGEPVHILKIGPEVVAA